MTTSDTGVPDELDSAKSRRELLLVVYKAAIDEYRFNVQLTWDRIKFFLLLNSGLIAAGVGLLKAAEGSFIPSAFLVPYFLLSIVTSVFGLQIGVLGKAYYREAIYTKTLVENELGLLDPLSPSAGPRDNLSIAVTRGQRQQQPGLGPADDLSAAAATQIGRGTIAFYSQMTFWIMIVIESLGAVAALANTFGKSV